VPWLHGGLKSKQARTALSTLSELDGRQWLGATITLGDVSSRYQQPSSQRRCGSLPSNTPSLSEKRKSQSVPSLGEVAMGCQSHGPTPFRDRPIIRYRRGVLRMIIGGPRLPAFR
jgi:hypothetical protein